MEKKYGVGMYGGKFMPLHKGHVHCLEIAAQECTLVYFIMFTHGTQEEQILSERNDDFLSEKARIVRLMHVAERYPNVIPVVINCEDCRLPDGSEDWDAETPLVLARCGHLDAVYGSEPSYADYFRRAYPDAVYRIVDVDRGECPISATMIRNMTNEEERKKWMA